MNIVPRGSNAVMSSRIEPPDSLDFFPTPPFATRALCEHVLFDKKVGTFHPCLTGDGPRIALPERSMTAWEPAAGEGHMAEPLKEYFRSVMATDVHDYGKGYGVGTFIGFGADRCDVRFDNRKADWIITNPPFNLAAEFIERALEESAIGVAIFARTVFLESKARYDLFQQHPMTVFAPFAERVCLTKGRWDPKGSTATSYAWFVWFKHQRPPKFPRLHMIPPGRKAALTRPEDITRFASEGG